MRPQFAISPLGPEHDRKVFSCGTPALDRYLLEQVGQDTRRRLAQCYVAHESGSPRIAGYYTLSAGDVPVHGIPEQIARKLPRYPVVPVARIGRLAIDTAFQGQRLAAALVADAAHRALRSELAVYALVVDAKDERADAFYRHLGFVQLSLQGQALFLPLATIAKGL